MAKYYLCVDLMNNRGEYETCYLAHEELEALLKYTSYCIDANMLINAFPHENSLVSSYIKHGIKKPIDIDSFYIKKTKTDNSFRCIYESNNDLLYADSKDAYNVLFKLGLTSNKLNNLGDIHTYLYEILSCLVSDKRIEKRINDNYWEKYDYDTNLNYKDYKNCKLWQKIALSDKNIKLVLDNIYNNTYKKLYFNSILKRYYNKKLISNEKIEKRKELLKRKLKIQRKDYDSINEQITKSIYEFYKNKRQIQKKEDALIKESKVPTSEDELNGILDYYKERIEDPDEFLAFKDSMEYEYRQNKRK